MIIQQKQEIQQLQLLEKQLLVQLKWQPLKKQQQKQQQKQQKQEQQLKKDNPVAYLKQKSKQVTTKKQTLNVANNSSNNTKSYVKGKDYINGKGPIDENYVEGKGPIDEDYVENPETGEAEVLMACGAGITGASALLVIIRKFLIKI